jgi:hypothetical protein
VIIYQSATGRVEKGWLSGFKVTFRANGRSATIPKWMGNLMAAAHHELKKDGIDTMNDPRAMEAFWEFFLAEMRSPVNGLAHQALASMPLEFTVGSIRDAIKASG